MVDISQLMQMAGQLREHLTSAQEQAASLRIPGEAGGGLVRVVMNGQHEVLELNIDPKAVQPGEVALLEDLVRAAVNQASAKVSEVLKERLGGAVSGMGLDLSALGLGGSDRG